MSIKVSVIIPVYNAEKYLSQCVESLLAQTLNECEFVFVNDGSSDCSGELLESYNKIDPRIFLIHQQNQGVSIARNNGLQKASGEYIGFVDADDYIEKDMYEILYTSAKQHDCDVVISNFESEIEGHKVITKYPFPIDIILNREYVEHELLPYFIKSDNLNSACNKIYKNNVIKENNVYFPERVPLGEDGMFNMQFFCKAANIKYLDFTGYHYREVKGSATRNISESDYFKRALEVYNLQLPENFTGKIDQVKIWKLKSIKLVNSVLSYLHVYFTPYQDVSFIKRYKYVKKMIGHKQLRDALNIYYSESYRALGGYEKFLVSMIKRKSAFGIYCATAYSRFKNKSRWGGI
ncbi:glycosyltransferase [Peribacillus psychrosaccharolyticus]|uniref:Glycosyltransferase n=1 Tax=Peribacillus psychrosaccharolyticus TaxID=1407 RepID=A0A974S0K7_PERPY|nr:glycosyltransferase [Peribacillus psychrosaccharolyticus]MEC2056056.1 glycosyltransferase [Peribacillus psychrosaccharolyticus]MED3745497.1 glycosyltransferase [Peribacillus psychrosaccharolyticus]QQT00747.1 glycosyltransferase [Peribacillus psychrosaccharolyticus]